MYKKATFPTKKPNFFEPEKYLKNIFFSLIALKSEILK